MKNTLRKLLVHLLVLLIITFLLSPLSVAADAPSLREHLQQLGSSSFNTCTKSEIGTVLIRMATEANQSADYEHCITYLDPATHRQQVTIALVVSVCVILLITAIIVFLFILRRKKRKSKK